jgi:hypothetical protein
VTGLPDGTRVLDIGGRRDFGYASTYFDTPDLRSFREAAHRRRRRFKVRTRLYADTGEGWLEVKTRGAAGLTVKDRLPLGRRGADDVGEADWAWVARTLAERGVRDAEVAGLTPALTVTYRRVTFTLPDEPVRVTVDTGVTWNTPGGASGALVGQEIVETKGAGRPCAVDRALWRQGHRPDRLSKYCTGLAFLTPGLVANRWSRTLARYFAGADEAQRMSAGVI